MSADPRTFRILGDHDGVSGGGCFWIEDEYGESQSENFGSRLAAQRYLDDLISNYEPPDPPGWEGGFAENH